MVEEQPRGWIVGWSYIGYVTEVGNSYSSQPEIYLFTTQKYFEKITKHNHELSQDEKDAKITVITRTGSYYCVDYNNKRKISMEVNIPRSNQEKIIDEIVTDYKKRNWSVVYIYGETETGKTMVAMLTAKYFGAEALYCSTHDPTNPSDSFTNLYSGATPTKEAPLIVCLNEFDVKIKKLHNGLIKEHKNVPVPIMDKSSFNNYLDDFDHGLFPFVIFIMAGNMSKEEITEMDKSYLRSGRVNLCFELKH